MEEGLEFGYQGGIIGTYLVAGFLMVVALVAAVLVQLYVKNSPSLPPLVWGVCGLVMLVAAVMLFVGTRVYWGNRWIVTSDSVTQVTQSSLFNVQSSQLSMGNIEDVTVEQEGVLPHAFGYGLLRVETAGERSKFVFMYCPKPNEYAKKILNAREQFEQGRRQDDQRLYREQGTYAGSYQQPEENTSPGGPTTPNQA